MKGGKRKDFSVYEFNEEDEAAEPAAGRFVDRFRARPDPKAHDPLTKYAFLHAFTSGTDYKKTDATDVYCIDMHTRECGDSYVIDTLERNIASAEDSSQLDEVVLSTPCDDQSCRAESERDLFVRDSLAVGASTFVTPVAVYSDDDQSCTSGSRSPSTTASDLSEKEGYWESPGSNNCYPASREIFEREINISPEYVVYGNVLYTKAHVTFASDCFRIENSDTCENEGHSIFEWELSDLICIDSRWSEFVEAAHVEIHLRANAVTGVEKVDEASSIVKMAFPIHDVRWLEKEQKIVSLAQRYRDIWNTISDYELVAAEEDVEPNMLSSRNYFTEILEPFEDVIYPKGDPDAVSISKRDVELLQPDTFINDTIIDFYIKYLKNKLQSDDKHRFHFFNSFFFRKLADLDKDLGSAVEGREAFQRVRKWTRKLDIFKKDYIFIPVNFSLHWSLLVICHPGEVANLEDDEMKESSRVPCILHMDSIKGSHNGLRNLVQSYLWEEWKERHSKSFEEYSPKFSNLRFVALELPQQENLFDCGLFLLHYVELFLEEAPINFSPFKITEFSSFLSVNWFEPSEASRKRSFIRKLIYDLRDDSSQKVLPTACSDEHLSLKCPKNDIKQKPVAKFLSEQCGAAKTSNCDSSSSIADRENELNLLTGFPLCGAQLDKAPGKKLREFIKLETSLLSFPDHQEHSFERDATCQTLKAGESTNKGHADEDRQFLSLNRERDDCQPIVESRTLQNFTSLYSLNKDAAHKASSSSMQEGKDVSGNSTATSRKSDSNASNQEEMENCECVPDSPTSASDENLEMCVDKYSSEIGLTKGGSQDSVDSTDAKVKVDDGDGVSRENHPFSFSQDVEIIDGRSTPDKDEIQLIRDEPVEGQEHKCSKRRKTMHPQGGRRQSQRFIKDTQR